MKENIDEIIHIGNLNFLVSFIVGTIEYAITIQVKGKCNEYENIEYIKTTTKHVVASPSSCSFLNL